MQQLKPPCHAGPFTVLKEIGKGGFSHVYLAVKDGGPCVLKVLRPEAVHNPKIFDRFLREVRISSALSHENLLAFKDSGKVGQHYFGVMDFHVGGTLHEYWEDTVRDGAFAPVELSLFWIREIAKALRYVHAQTVFEHSRSVLFHGDVSPENIYITPKGRVFLMDFGSAFQVTSADHTDTHFGKLSYLPFEITKGVPVTTATDVYSLAVLAFILFYSKKPFQAESKVELLKVLEKGEIPKIHRPNLVCDSRGQVSLRILFNKAFHKDPALRFQTVVDFMDALLAIGFTKNPLEQATSSIHLWTERFRKRIMDRKTEWAREFEQADLVPISSNDLFEEEVIEKVEKIQAHEDVRKYPRVPIEGKMAAEVVSISARQKSKLPVHELGRGGMLLKWEIFETHVGQTYPVVLDLEDGQPPLRALAEVRYEMKRGQRTYVGFQFSKISPKNQARLDRYLSQKLGDEEVLGNTVSHSQQISLEVYYPSHEEWIHELRENISRGGIYVQAKQAFDLDELVQLNIQVPTEKTKITVTGRVVHCSPLKGSGLHGVGVELDAKDQNLIHLKERYKF